MLNDTIDRNRQRRRRIHNRRRQKVRRQLMLIGAVLILVIMSIVSCTVNHLHKKKAQETVKVEKEEKQEKKKEKEEEEQKETPGDRLMRVKQEAQEAGYPEEIIELLSKNEETIEFVEHYGAKKDTPPADTVGEVTQGAIPLLLQWDERWGYAPYGTSTVAVSGCGPTCMAMVLAGLTGDASITPAKVAAYSMENGYIDSNTNDTTWLFMEEVSQNWGVSCYETINNESTIASELGSGHPIICSVGPGDFTRNGHFIVLTDYDDGNVTIHDPFSVGNSEKMWVYTDIADQFQAMWAYYQ